jgi:hypothetical protein
MYVVVSLLTLLLVVGALVDIITRSDEQVKHLPKMVWVLLVVFLPLVGSILWFLVGREYPASNREGLPRRARPHEQPEATRPHHHSATRIETTEEQLRRVEREIEFHEKQARIARLQAELDRRRAQPE